MDNTVGDDETIDQRSGSFEVDDIPDEDEEDDDEEDVDEDVDEDEEEEDVEEDEDDEDHRSDGENLKTVAMNGGQVHYLFDYLTWALWGPLNI